MKIKCLFFCLLVLAGFSDPCVDINYSPYCGAENIVFVQKGMEKIENWIFPSPTITAEDLQNPAECVHFSKEARWMRQARSVLIGVPSNASLVVTQHEVFGHGYRVRDLGSKYAKVTGYKMYVIFGSTAIDITNQLTTSQNIAIDIAGMEADAILANKVRMTFLTRGGIDGREGILYLMSALGFTGYALSTHGTPKTVPETGNDIQNFLYFLNITYPDGNLKNSTVRNLSLLNLINPFIYNAIVSQWVKDAVCLPSKLFMIPIGPVQYLPSIRTALSPFGMQGYLENFFVVNSIPTYLYLKWGKNGSNTYWGVGVENQKVFNWKTGSLGFRLDFWNQPHVLFQQGALSVQQIYDLPKGAPIPELYPSSVLQAKSIGVAFSMISSFGSEKWPFRFFSEIGYKTAGYLPGEALRESPIARGGLSGQF